MTTNPFTEWSVDERVAVFTLGGDDLLYSFGSNATAILGDATVALVDPFVSRAHARMLEAVLSERGAGRVRLVVLTHHHTDHALGAGWFAEKGAMVVCHRLCGLAMKAEHPRIIAARRAMADVGHLFADAEPVSPHLVFDSKEPQFMNVGPLGIEVLYMGWGHSKGDVIVRVPSRSVIVCGDLVSNGYHLNLEDADVAGLRRSIAALKKFGARSYVPGHGAPGGAEILEAQLAWLDAMEDAVREAVGAAPSRDAARDRAVAEMKSRFPGYRLESALPTAFERLAPPA